MHWTKVDCSPRDPHPMKRANHSAVCLGYGEDHPQILVTGGSCSVRSRANYTQDESNQEADYVGDSWILDVQSGKWRKVFYLGEKLK